jgi:hypothetical protein
MDYAESVAEYGILVDGFRRGDADSLGKWLSLVAKAQRLYEEAKLDACFRDTVVERLEVCYVWDFELEATLFAAELIKGEPTIVEVGDHITEVFAVMAHMGFFMWNGDGYRMSVPQAMNVTLVKDAAATLIATQDDEYMIYPEKVLYTRPLREVERLKRIHVAVQDLGQLRCDLPN